MDSDYGHLYDTPFAFDGEFQGSSHEHADYYGSQTYAGNTQLPSPSSQPFLTDPVMAPVPLSEHSQMSLPNDPYPGGYPDNRYDEQPAQAPEGLSTLSQTLHDQILNSQSDPTGEFSIGLRCIRPAPLSRADQVGAGPGQLTPVTDQGSPPGRRLHRPTMPERARGAKSHPCAECRQSFERRSDLNRHIESQNTEGARIVCPECEKRFPKRRKDKLRNHIHKKHPGVTQEAIESLVPRGRRSQ